MIKQSDIAVLILITAISLVVAYFIGNAVINSPDSRSTLVEIAIPISEDFPEPDVRIFNKDSINLTEKIEIGDSNTVNPFESQ